MAEQTISTQEFLGRAHTQLDRLESAFQGIASIQREHRDKIAALERVRANALEELTVSLLPELSPQYLAGVQAATGYGQFAVDDPIERMHARQQQLGAEVQAIEANETYIRRDALIGAVTGALTLRLAAIEEDMATLRPGLEQYERDPRLIRLIHSGYDTEAYHMPWWHLQYYRDWKWGDVYTEQFQQHRFNDVREAYLRLAESRRLLEQDRARVQAEMHAVQELIDRRQHALDALTNLEADTLAQCRKQLQEHLAFIDRAELAQRAANAPARTSLLKRLHGIEKKIAYLNEMTQHHIALETGLLASAMQKLQRKIDRFQRPKHRHARIPTTEANAWLRDPTPRISAWRQRYTRNYDHIYGFEAYDAYTYGRDLLWWDLMTDGRIDGDFIPEVHAWRDSHPETPRALERDLLRASGAYTPADQSSPDVLEVS
jgi:hypothetical protein